MKTTKAIEEYKSYMQFCGQYSIETLDHYMTYIQEYYKYLQFKKAYEIEDITIKMCEDYSMKVIKQLTFDASYKRIVVAKNFHNWLEFVHDYPNVANHMILPKRPERLPVYCSHDEIDAITEQLKRDMESGKLPGMRAARNAHVRNLGEKINLDEDYNYKHYYDLTEGGKWKVRGRA